MTALPNLFATTAHDHIEGERCRADVFAPDDDVRHHLASGACDLFSTQPLDDRHRLSPIVPALTTDATAPRWMPELLATVDASPPGRRAAVRLADAFGEEGARHLRARRPETSPRVVRRRRRTRRHAGFRRLRASWIFTTGDATLP
ncbi:hypothetical protein [Dermatobacter hominis]|uniref:hypothetical protein n=1 Tax=Dermatobacter hominis TaxID=2884263 RepID=UPI001D1013A3|nr:hypothetical protein [Dermatobacter hominis]UDY34717.1 hypothetical protein LH044_15415 [Dermatobacter hominis]